MSQSKPAPQPERQITSDLEALQDAPFALILRLIGHHDLVSLIKLASTNKFFQHKIYRSDECRHLWKTIDFSKVGPDRDEELEIVKYAGFSTEHLRRVGGEDIPMDSLVLTLREKLTDASLAALLRRTDAKSVTETLILAGCKNLDGSGLTPIFGSTILRGLDLAFCRDEFRNTMLHVPDVKSITSLLESLGPLGGNAESGFLLWIRSPFWGGGNFLNVESLKREMWGEMERTLTRFRSSLATRIRDSGTACARCNEPLYNKVVSTNPNASDCKFCKRVSECRVAWDDHLRSFPDETEEDIFPLISNHHKSNMFQNFAAKLVCYQCNKVACGQKKCPETLRCCTCTMQLCGTCSEMIICSESFSYLL